MMKMIQTESFRLAKTCEYKDPHFFTPVSYTHLIPVCIHNVGGLSGMNAGLININEGLATLWGEDYYLKGAPLMIAGIALVYFIGYMGQPHLIIKTVAIKDEKSIKLVPMIGAAFGFVLSFGVYILGMVGRVAYPDISMLPGGSAEYIMPMMALSNLPPVLSGLILACLLYTSRCV